MVILTEWPISYHNLGECPPIIRLCEKCGDMLRIEKVEYKSNGEIEARLSCPSKSIFQFLLTPCGHSEVDITSYDGGATWDELEYVWM